MFGGTYCPIFIAEAEPKQAACSKKLPAGHITITRKDVLLMIRAVKVSVLTAPLWSKGF
jgi:hypothetical protein